MDELKELGMRYGKAMCDLGVYRQRRALHGGSPTKEEELAAIAEKARQELMNAIERHGLADERAE